MLTDLYKRLWARQKEEQTTIKKSRWSDRKRPSALFCLGEALLEGCVGPFGVCANVWKVTIKQSKVFEDIEIIPHKRLRKILKKGVTKRLAAIEKTVKEKATNFAYMELRHHLSMVPGKTFDHAHY